jgi:hypothetical protein
MGPRVPPGITQLDLPPCCLSSRCYPSSPLFSYRATPLVLPMV